MALGPYSGYKPLLLEIARFFDSGISPIDERETLEILAFMEAADEGKKSSGASVALERIFEQATKTADSFLDK